MAIALRSPSECSFRAVWHEKNSYLKLRVTEQNLYQKIRLIVWNLFSLVFLPIGIARFLGWMVRFVAKKAILPSAWFYPHQILQRAKRVFNECCQKLEAQFQITKHRVMTPDGVKLKALHFLHRNANENTPTVLFYQSNASISHLGIYLWLVEEAVRRNCPCNFVVFDYRGVGGSSGDAQSTRELLIDGDTALQFVRDYLHVPSHLIHWYTWSLGGGIGSNIKALYPECTGPLVHERSFYSLRSVADHLIPSFLKPLFFWVPYAADLQGWDLTAQLNRLKGRTLVVYHRDDPVIPYPASAHQAATRANLSVQSLELHQTEEQKALAQERFVDHHFEALDNYYAAPGLKADQAIANFILPTQETPCP